MFDFSKLAQDALNFHVTTFNTIISQQPHTDPDPYFIFYGEKLTANFKQQIAYLNSPVTLETSFLNQYTLVAQTIDGDYIAANDQQTVVIPISLMKADVEYYSMTIFEFMIAYQKGQVNSNILANNL